MKKSNNQIKQITHYPELQNASKILHLKKSLTLFDLKKAYRKMAFKYHPDICKNNRKSWCKKKFIEINKAKKLLEDFLTGNYKPVSNEYSEKIMEEKMSIYRDYIDHVKRFYDEWFGGLNF